MLASCLAGSPRHDGEVVDHESHRKPLKPLILRSNAYVTTYLSLMQDVQNLLVAYPAKGGSTGRPAGAALLCRWSGENARPR